MKYKTFSFPEWESNLQPLCSMLVPLLFNYYLCIIFPSDEDVYSNLESSVNELMLSCPEYHSFDDLASKMIDCVPSGAVKMMILEEGSGVQFFTYFI